MNCENTAPIPVTRPRFPLPDPDSRYRTFINFLKAAAELGFLKEYDYKH